MKSSLLAFIALSTFLFEAHLAEASSPWSGLGLWASSSEDLNTIVLRLPDHTYRMRQIQLYDYKKPPIYFFSAGKWLISRKKYTYTMNAISAPMWKRYVGMKISCDIVSKDKKTLTFCSPDGVVVDEHKIGGLDEVKFEKYPLQLPDGARPKWRMYDVTR